MSASVSSRIVGSGVDVGVTSNTASVETLAVESSEDGVTSLVKRDAVDSGGGAVVVVVT